MRKVLIFAVLAVFLFSTVPSLASPTPKIEPDISASSLTIADGNESGSLPIQTREDSGQGDIAGSGQAMESQVSIKDQAEEAIVVEKAVDAAKVLSERVIEKYDTAKDNYLLAKSNYMAAKSKWLEARAKFIGAKTNENKAFAIDAAKEFLTTSIDNVEKHLQMIDSKINSLVMDDNTKALLLSDIDQYKAFLEQKRSEVTAAVTEDDVMKVSEELRSSWNEIRPFEEKAIGIILNERIGALITKAETISANVGKRVDALKDKGYDVSGIEGLLAAFDGKIASAKSAYEAAKTKYAAATDVRAGGQLIKDANAYVASATQDVKDAQAQLKQMLVDLIKGAANSTGG